MLKDTNTVRQVLGGLMVRPQYLIEKDRYNLSLADFSSQFEKVIFSAINTLVENGARTIEPIDIVNVLEQDTVGITIFNQNNGIEYTQDLADFAQINNFDYYYNKLKKLNLLKMYKKQGIDISEFYQEDLTAPNAEIINHKFEELTLSDICGAIKKKVIKIEANFEQSATVESWEASDKIDEVISHFGEMENFGLPINGFFMNRVINGAEISALTIRSLASGVGKTRLAVADACKLAFPFYWEDGQGWVKNGGTHQDVLFIMTEQQPEQILKMVLAYLTNINESKFRGRDLTKEELDRLLQAQQMVKDYGTLHLMRIPDPDISQIKLAVREKVLTEQIKYVFFDYVFISPALLQEFRGNNLRNDEALLLMATALKDLAVELKVSVFTSTQVNAKIDDNKEIRSEAALAGGRSTINKADNGIIGARPTNDEIDILKSIGELSNLPVPNIVFDVFKVRSGRWTQIRIWSQFDAGTLRLKDLYITDSRLNVIHEVEDDYERNWELDEKDAEYLCRLRPTDPVQTDTTDDVKTEQAAAEYVVVNTNTGEVINETKKKPRFDFSL